MKIKKLISRVLVSSILIGNIGSYSLAAMLSEDSRYETFEGNNITIDNILEEDKVDLEIEGSTVVNLLGEHTGLVRGFTYDSDTGIYSISLDGVDVPTSNPRVNFSNAVVETGKTYTIVLDIIENTLVRESGSVYYKFNVVSHQRGGISETKQGFTGRKVQISVQPTESTGFPYIEVISACVGKFSFKNPMILEGDWTNKEIPKYIDGIKSGFEDQVVTQEMINSGLEKQENLGKYKVEVKSTGKNLLKGSDDVSKKGNGWSPFDNASITNEYYKNSRAYTTNGKAWSSYGYSLYELIKNNSLNLDNYYTFSCYVKSSAETYSPRFWFYINNSYATSNSTLVSTSINTSWQRVSVTFKFNKNVLSTSSSTSGSKHYNIRFEPGEASLNGEYLMVAGLQLEENLEPTIYEHYKEYLNTFYLNSPLLEGDTIEYINGQATHIRRYGQVTLDGNTLYIPRRSALNDSIGYRWIIWQDDNVGDFTSTEKYTFNNRYNNASAYNSFFGIEEGISQNSSQNLILLYLERYSDGSESSKQSLINELQENPVTVVYKLSETIYEPIRADLSVQLFEGTTYISNNSTVPVNMKVTVDRALNRAIEAIKLAKENPILQNISKARMWVNMLDESILKDELQQEISSITQVKDLEIDKKTATANLDIYIKNEDMLSMSLNTNSIVFDDYSAVESLENRNAVGITISSSLPYDLNAYLESSISNSSKGNELDINILKIKESNKQDYNSFGNIKEKLILGEDYQAGNYVNHNIDLKLEADNSVQADTYKTTIKFEAVQK